MPTEAIYLILGFSTLNGRLPRQQRTLPRNDTISEGASASTERMLAITGSSSLSGSKTVDLALQRGVWEEVCRNDRLTFSERVNEIHLSIFTRWHTRLKIHELGLAKCMNSHPGSGSPGN